MSTTTGPGAALDGAEAAAWAEAPERDLATAPLLRGQDARASTDALLADVLADDREATAEVEAAVRLLGTDEAVEGSRGVGVLGGRGPRLHVGLAAVPRRSPTGGARDRLGPVGGAGRGRRGVTRRAPGFCGWNV